MNVRAPRTRAPSTDSSLSMTICGPVIANVQAVDGQHRDIDGVVRRAVRAERLEIARLAAEEHAHVVGREHVVVDLASRASVRLDDVELQLAP